MTLTLSAHEVRLLRLRSQRLLSSGGGPSTSPERVLQEVCGVQAQDLQAALLSMRARSAGLTSARVERARQAERSIVRTWCMRGTLHLVAAEDARWLIPLLGPRLLAAKQRRFQQLGWDEKRAAAGLRLLQEALAEENRMSGRGLTRAQIVDLLQENGLPCEGQAPVYLLFRAALEGLICHGPHLEDEATYVLFEPWIGKPQPLPREEALTELARRYLQAYGPAGPEDMARWSRLKLGEIRKAWQRLAPELVRVEIEGQDAWLLKSHLPRLDQGLDRLVDDAPAVRLLPRFDTYLLGYTSRDLVVEPAYAKRVHPGGGIIHPVLMVNGQAVGTWKTKRRSDHVDLLVEPFEGLADEILPPLEAEVADLARFLGEEAVLIIEEPSQ